VRIQDSGERKLETGRERKWKLENGSWPKLQLPNLQFSEEENANWKLETGRGRKCKLETGRGKEFPISSPHLRFPISNFRFQISRAWRLNPGSSFNRQTAPATKDTPQKNTKKILDSAFCPCYLSRHH
jgi:hypothetical protein